MSSVASIIDISMAIQSTEKNPISNLSFGQQKKLALLRVFLNNSDLIILDEPFVGLDDGAHKVLTSFLNDELNNNKSLVFTSHIPCNINSKILEIPK